MKKTIRTLSVFLVVAVLSVCGCLFGCSSKQNPDPVDPSLIVVETVDIIIIMQNKNIHKKLLPFY